MDYRIAEHRIIRANENDYLFLSGEKAIFEMDLPTREFISKWSRCETFRLDETFADLKDFGETGRNAFIKGLIRRRALVPKSAPGTADCVQAAPPAVEIPIKTLIMHVTDACNLNCAYCYEGARGVGRRQQMSMDTARQAVDFLMGKSQDLRDLVIVFFGGEPLLNFPVIENSVAYAHSQAERLGKRIDFAMTTNGTLLSRPIIDFLYRNRVSVTVSLDGTGESHDRYRRFADGRPTYDLIRKNIDGLLAPGAQSRPAVARVTLTRGFGEVPAILDHLLGLGFVEAGFAPVTSGAQQFQLTEEDMNRLLEQFGRLCQRFVEETLNGRFLGFSNIIDLLVSLHQGEVMDYPCGAGLMLFSVGTSGDLYLCQRFTGNEDYCMGSIGSGLTLHKIEAFRQEARICNKEACRTCWARTVCMGGCYHEACVREGSHLQPNRHYCDWIKKWTARGLEVYCQLASQRPEFLDMLSASRGNAT